MGKKERIYEWDVARLGDTSPPYVFTVTRQAIEDYCRAVRNDNLAYRDDSAARAQGFPGVLAPPSMVFTYAPMCRMALINARGYVAPEQARSPRSTPFVGAHVLFQGLVQPGDMITSATTLLGKFERKGNRFITFRIVGHNQREEKVADYLYTCLWEYAKGQSRLNATDARRRPGLPPLA